MPLRTPAVAGSFYPGSRNSLLSKVSAYCPTMQNASPAYAIISPHAGYVYSGSLAGSVFARTVIPNTLVMLCPNHTGMGSRASVWPGGSWLTPLGEVNVDSEVAELLIDTVPFFEADTKAHLREHSIEVLLPFVQHRNPAAKIVPVSISLRGLDQLLEAGVSLANALMGTDVLLVGSTDMTHFESVSAAAAKDEPALRAIMALDPEALYRHVIDNRVTMCGVLPVTLLLKAISAMGAKNAVQVGYTHSGIASGDNSEVVAYAGFVFPKENA